MEHAEHRIWVGLVAFACGDAAGVPWETMPPVADAVPRLPAHRDWPTGSVSDDTMFLLSTAQVLASGNPSPRALLEQLAADLPRARGAGRTSRAGIERFIQTGQTSAKTGATNGAAMRALPIGWASPAKDVKRRVGQGIALARATHGDRSAIAAAVAVAAMGAWSVEGASIGEVVDQGSIEARVCC
jgi:ADP-ribosyl-[dinitrogen reductase] hydrolase